MNKHYWGLWALLATAFVIFAVLSLWPDGIRVGGYNLKTPSLSHMIHEMTVDNDTTAADSLDASGRLPNGRHPKGWRAPMDTTAKTILFIGDSMLEGLGERLAAYCDKNGHKLIEVIWYSSATLHWGETARLTELMGKYHPDYIMVCLGANELYVPDIKNARRPYLKKMLAEIGDLPYLWIGPPNWDEGCFYYSAGDKFTRSRDGAHPTRTSAHAWMDRVVKWMNTTGAYPIRLNYPGEGISRATRIVVYQPPV